MTSAERALIGAVFLGLGVALAVLVGKAAQGRLSLRDAPLLVAIIVVTASPGIVMLALPDLARVLLPVVLFGAGVWMLSRRTTLPGHERLARTIATLFVLGGATAMLGSVATALLPD